jgi:hypothetical protein
VEPQDPKLNALAAARALDEISVRPPRKRRRQPIIGLRFLIGMLFGLAIAWYLDGRITITSDCVEVSPECDAPAPARTGWL